MLSIGRLFGLILLFLFFEVVVLVLGRILLPDANVLWVCAGMTAIAVAVWVVYVVVTRWMMRPRVAQPVPAKPIPVSAGAPAPLPADPEQDDLKSLIREAEKRLTASPAFAGQKPDLTRLPVYVAIGLDGVGKTSTLVNSGLDPRLLAGESFRDAIVVPTKLCNIWYAADSVIVDVGGRLFDDPARWTGLLRLLTGRQEKPLLRRLWEGRVIEQNLRGVLLFCDVNTFLRSPDPQRTAALSRRLQERLQTVGQVIGSEFPVYTIFTKSDAIPFFGEFFRNLSDEEDRRVLGCTLPVGDDAGRAAGEVYNEAENKRLSGYLNRLYQSLADKRLTFLGRETVAGRKPFIYEFPREIKRIRPEVVKFLVETFRPNPLHRGALLRGFYFSGIRQVAKAASMEVPGDVSQVRAGGDATVFFKAGDARTTLSSSMSRRPTPSQEATVPRWVFLSDLFHRIVLPDRAVVAAPSMDPRTELYRYAGFGAVAALCLMLVLGFVTSWANNRTLLHDAQDAARASALGGRDSQSAISIDNLRAMDALRTKLALLSGYERNGPPWSLRWGLYTGNEALTQLRSLYFSRFRQLFLNPVLVSLTSGFGLLKPGAESAYGDVYERLKTYRTVTSGECKPDRPVVSKVVSDIWIAGRSLDPQVESLARRQIDFYASELAVSDPYGKRIEEDAGARNQAQAYLLSFKGAEQLYRGLIAAVNQPPQQAAKLANYAPNFNEVLTGPTEVEASFTRQGWDLVQQRIRDGKLTSIGETCVVGTNKAAEFAHGLDIQRELQNLYINGYIKAWRTFLAGQGIVPYRGVGDAVHKLDILDSNRSPILGAILMIADNTNFPPKQAGSSEAIESKVKNSVTSAFDRLVPRAKKAKDEIAKSLPVEAPPLSQTDIFQVFQPVRTVVNPGDKDHLVTDANRTYINSLAELKSALDALPPDRNANLDVALNDKAHAAAEKARAAVRDMAQRFNVASAQGTDTDLARFLELPIDFTDPFIQKDPHKLLRDKVNGQLRALCGKLSALQRKYPFNPQADAEVTVQEFTAVFAPGTGAIWGFLALPPPLTGLLIKQGDLWMQNPAVPEPRLTPEFIDFFNRLAKISTTLFPEGAASPHLQYTVQPLPSDGVQATRLTVDGTVVGSTGRPAQFTWPSPSGSSTVDLHAVIDGVGVGYGSYSRSWAIFKMMDDAGPRRADGDIYSFSGLHQGRSQAQQVTNAKGDPVTVRLLITFPGGFDPRTFRVRCPAAAAQ